jgi:hypothetical protein
MIPHNGYNRYWTSGRSLVNLDVMSRAAAIACLALLLGCSGGEDPPHLQLDGASVQPDLGRDALPVFDVYLPPLEDTGPVGDAGCVLGTPDNCGYCGDRCSPGTDTVSTARVCITGKCGIQCKDEYYDVDSSAANGCEVQDDVPIHASKPDAADQGQMSDCNSPKTFSGVIPSDDRLHQKAPTDRRNGRADWFKVYIDDDPGCFVDAAVKVSFKNLPTGASYRAATYYVCDNGKEFNDSLTTYGGQDVLLQPSTVCTTLGDDSGNMYIEITKESGPHSSATYSIEVTP